MKDLLNEATVEELRAVFLMLTFVELFPNYYWQDPSLWHLKKGQKMFTAACYIHNQVRHFTFFIFFVFDRNL